MAELDLEALRALVEDGERRRAQKIAHSGQAQADWISDNRYHHTTWTGDLGIPLAAGRAILNALERIPKLEGMLDEAIGQNMLQAVRLAHVEAVATLAPCLTRQVARRRSVAAGSDCGWCVACRLRTALAAATAAQERSR